MLIDVNTIPIWVVENARLPAKLLGPTEDCEGADFYYCVESAMLEDIEWQESLELTLDKPLLIERKWYRKWFATAPCMHKPDTLYDRLVLKTRFRCIYKRLQKNGDLRKEYVRIMVRALDY